MLFPIAISEILGCLLSKYLRSAIFITIGLVNLCRDYTLNVVPITVVSCKSVSSHDAAAKEHLNSIIPNPHPEDSYQQSNL